MPTSEGVHVEDGGEIIRRRDEEITGLRSWSKSRRLSADLEGAQVKTSVSGEGSRGESANQVVATILVKRLNEDGASWSEPQLAARDSRAEEGVDFKAHDRSNTSLVLHVQVTKAMADGEYWRALNQNAVASDTRHVDQAADDLMTAIDRKFTITASQQRASLVLALDAIKTPGHALQPVATSFAARHGPWASRLGFQAIWIVGHSVALTRRIA
jgi:hypothetical protein